jgi:mRNA interferase RelE/StbE
MKVDYAQDVQKQLAKMIKGDKVGILHIRKYMAEVETLNDPRSRGEELHENLAGFWRYRIGSYRVICDIQDDNDIIMVVHVGHRKEVYK